MSGQSAGGYLVGRKERALFCLSLAASIGYCAHAFLGRSTPEIAMKAAAILAIALIVFMRKPPLPGLVLGIGLLFHSAGDVFLLLNEKDLFIPALGGFFLGHLSYLAAFVMLLRLSGPVQWKRLAWASPLIPFLAVMMVLLQPKLEGVIAFAVPVYMLVISAMAVTAFLCGFRPPTVQAGALLFVLSDSIIALTTFIAPMEYSRLLTWPTYYIGQALMVFGFMKALAYIRRDTP